MEGHQMRKTTKRMLATLTAAVLTASCFASCSNQKTDGNTLLIGGIGPLTGGAAVYGQAVKNGAELAIQEINEAGGVNGIKLAIDFQDDEHDPEKAVNAYNTLKDGEIKLLMGTVTSNPCIAVAEKAKEDNMFMLTPSGSAVKCTQYDNAFRICFNDPSQGNRSAQYIAENNLATKVAVIYDSSDAYSSGIYENFAAEAAARNIEIVEAQAFTSDSNTDFSVQIQKIQEAAPELVFLPIYYEEAALILKQADTAGLKVKFFGCDGLDGVVDQLGDDVALAEGVMLLTPFVTDENEASKAFTEAYKAAYDNQTPNQFAADAYDAIYTIKAALEKAGVTDPSISVHDLCEKLKAAMTEITVEGLTGTMTWTADGECSKEPKAMKIENGEYTALN
jgi:branched-chain amino acid transport system substrate-binding protein